MRPKEPFHRSIAVVIGVMSVGLSALGVGTRARAQTFATGPANFDWRLPNLDLPNSRYGVDHENSI
jgi:hypothetical protein